MSGWEIGSHDSEELISLRKQLLEKDSQYANLQSQLLKRNQDFEEMRRTLDDSVQKLRAEAERALDFEKNLGQCTESLQAEKIARQNAEISIISAQDKINLREKEAKELQAIIDALSNGADNSRVLLLQLQEQKTRLENQVKELQADIRERSITPAPQRRARRTSSLSNTRQDFLECELNELRTTYTKTEAELHTTKDELQRVQINLCNAENERLVVEKRLKARISELEDALEQQKEEVLSLKACTSDDSAAQREEDLVYRIEREESTVKTLNEMVDTLESEKRSLRKKADAEAARAADLESRNVELETEKEQALNSLDEFRTELKETRENCVAHERHIQNLTVQETNLRKQVEQLQAAIRPQLAISQREDGRPQLVPEDSSVVADMERLLTAVTRLRGERDGLRRDLEFLQMESSITIETLQKKLFAAKERQQDEAVVAELQDKINVLRTQLVEGVAQHSQALLEKDENAKLLEAQTLALASTVKELQTQVEETNTHNVGLKTQLDKARQTLQKELQSSQSKDLALANLKATVEQAHSRVTPALEELHQLREERENLRCRIGELQDEVGSLTKELGSTKRELAQTELHLEEAQKSLEDVESQRESLTTEVTNLQMDLEAARHDLENAEQRNDTLQAKQLLGFSSYEATKALREQIETLEQRVQRRTEQIGIHQHDIKRLEVNLRLQEERANEMIAELEEMTRQKEAMVEDCAAARETRDDVLLRVEALESELEMSEMRAADAEVSRQTECAALIGAWVSVMTRLKSAQVLLRQRTASAVSEPQQMDIDEPLAVEELAELRSAHQRCLEELGEKHAALQSLEVSRAATSEDLRLVTVALASVKAEFISSSDSMVALRAKLALFQGRARALEEEAETKSKEIALLSEGRQLSEQQYADAVAEKESLMEIKASLEQQLEELQRATSESQGRHKEEIEALVRARDETEQRMSEVLARSRSDSMLCDQLESLRSAHSQELVKLQDQLSGTVKDLEKVEQLRDSLASQLRNHEQSHTETKGQLAAAEATLQKQLGELEGKHAEELSQAKADLQQEIDHLKTLLDESETSRIRATEEVKRLSEEHTIEVRELQTQLTTLETNIERLDQECQSAKDQLRESSERQDALVAGQQGTRRLLADVRNQLQAALDELESLRQEKNALQMELRKSASQLENTLNVRIYLEDKLKDSEVSLSSLREQLERLKSDLLRSEKAEKTAEMKLSLQSTEHGHVVASLKREIERLKSRPDFEAEAIELRGQIEQIDELLRSKSAEIEESDDKFIELLKEKKKLSTKVETLTRKVQTLQAKLSAAKGASSTPEVSKPAFSRPSPAVVIVPPVPSLAMHIANASVLGTPSGRGRTISGPSSIPQPKTPESKGRPFSRAKTPERKYQPASETASSFAGKKRPVPEDFDNCESVPPQGIVAERLVTFGEENMTPRLRRPFQTARTGFTPQRTMVSRTTPKQPSPRRMTTGAAAPVISDVTNSPRARVSSVAPMKSSKSGWLGKIRGASSTQPLAPRPFPSRPAFDYDDDHGPL
ncbi:hypothetical protein NEOLEDRAFT_1083593 [Neolentinus lepideus HHB14362 ss-1]|uniref:Uncharacterized protein n=1 Tax=Neolentinus lepideus HHB14362 ss-1 TaxID=1314782 RepID=A0A165WCA2_9AGAM|nr:hypothetical protein NEOLEDRAFT_1083593 [Neolentinus lepideus HHB14362 ss-1]